ncbi:hypothetical protein FACS1894109_02850 [Spirochaetia bacterium]|nr:hypothetical protein FACS1894109_02850 [Spirochaetia bacterium]
MNEVSNSFIVKATYEGLVKEFPITYTRSYNLVLNKILVDDFNYGVSQSDTYSIGTDLYYTTGFGFTAAINTGTNSTDIATFLINKKENEILQFLQDRNLDVFTVFPVEKLLDYIRFYSGRITFTYPAVDGWVRYIYIENTNGYSVGNMGDQTKWSIRSVN